MDLQKNSTSDKVEIAGAITYPPQNRMENVTDDSKLKQPKAPTNLQGLLQYAMEAKGDEPPQPSKLGPLDTDRKKFLEDALNSMTVDVIDILQNKIKILQNAGNLTEDTDISEYTLALETILEYVDNIDTANDFHKIGGFTIFHPCVKCIHPEIRAGACDILAELCQNNPYCQRVVLDNAFIPLLIRILGNDNNVKVCTKALYAISCIIRQNTEGFHQLLQHEGLIVLLKTLKNGDEKLIIKTTFLLSSLCNSQPDLKSRLIFLDYIPVILTLVQRERNSSHEHILSLLLLLVQDSHAAVNECRNPKYELEKTLRDHLKLVEKKEECQEEEGYCLQLLRILFPPNNNGL